MQHIPLIRHIWRWFSFFFQVGYVHFRECTGFTQTNWPTKKHGEKSHYWSYGGRPCWPRWIHLWDQKVRFIPQPLVWGNGRWVKHKCDFKAFKITLTLLGKFGMPELQECFVLVLFKLRGGGTKHVFREIVLYLFVVSTIQVLKSTIQVLKETRPLLRECSSTFLPGGSDRCSFPAWKQKSPISVSLQPL